MMNHNASVSGICEPPVAVVDNIARIAKPSKDAGSFTYALRNSFGCRNELIPHPLIISLTLSHSQL